MGLAVDKKKMCVTRKMSRHRRSKLKYVKSGFPTETNDSTNYWY